MKKHVKNKNNHNYFSGFSIFIIFIIFTGIFLLFNKLFSYFEGNKNNPTSIPINKPIKQYNCGKNTFFDKKSNTKCIEKNSNGTCKTYSPKCVTSRTLLNPCPDGEYALNWRGTNRTKGPPLVCAKLYNTNTSDISNNPLSTSIISNEIPLNELYDYL